MQTTQKRRRRRRRHSKRYKRRVRQLILRLIFIIIIVIGIICTVNGFKGKDEKEKPKDPNPVVKEEEKKDIVKEDLEKEKLRSLVIVLDPGHGGNDSGGVWEDIYEKEIDLSIVKETAKILREEGYTVACTRYCDGWVDLYERSKIAEKNNADVFVSVHQNALENDTTSHGIETHCNENANSNSLELANLIQQSVIEETQARDRGVATGSDLVVVQSKIVPSCLVETGFLTSNIERDLLLNEDYQKKIATGIANGIREYLKKTAGQTTEYTADSSQ